jgi:hypothetical protein
MGISSVLATFRHLIPRFRSLLGIAPENAPRLFGA